jgi:hypothetical protein
LARKVLLTLAALGALVCGRSFAQTYPAPSLPLTGSEITPCIQSGSYKSCTVGDQATFAIGTLVADPRNFGAVCGTTPNVTGPDATSAIQAAVNSLSTTGGTVIIACALTVAGTVAIPGNVRVTGVGAAFYAGMYASPASNGIPPTWPITSTPSIDCTNASGFCFNISGQGVEIDHLNLGNPQPTPGATFTPTPYGYVIGTSGNWSGLNLHDLTFTSADFCIDLEGSPDYFTNGIAGAQWTITNIWFNPCFNEGILFHNIDNTGRISDVDYDFWWYRGNSLVGSYVESHSIGMEFKYLANAEFSNIEFAFNKDAILLTNSTVTGGFGNTFSGFNVQMSNVGFNEVCQGVGMSAANGTISAVQMINVVAYTDTISNCAVSNSTPIFFDLSSDDSKWSINHLLIGDVQTIAAIGHGAGGNLTMTDVDAMAYSFYSTGANAFKVSANTTFSLGGNAFINIHPQSGAGALIGPGVDGSQGFQAPIQVGGGGGITPTVDGAVTLQSSGNNTSTGLVEFLLPSGVRQGLVGAGTAAGINIQADTGAVFLRPRAGAGAVMSVGLDTNGKLQINVNGLPTSCTTPVAEPTGTLVDISGAVQVCP